MAVIELHLEISEDQQEFFCAEFMDDFEAFRMEGNALWAYLADSSWNAVILNRLESWLTVDEKGRFIDLSEIAEKNWNDEWEKSIEAIEAGGFIVHPSWSPNERNDLEAIVIDPKMSFGTGHHETTRLMLSLIRNCPCEGKFILDAGSGTGVLAIAAVKLGAKRVIAFDIDPLCIKNGVENRQINQVDEAKLIFRTGEFSETIQEIGFDGIFANINKNALVGLLDRFHSALSKDGYLLVSGLLKSDELEFLDRAREANFEFVKVEAENEWIAIHLIKSN